MTHGDLSTLVEFNYWARDRMLEPVSALGADEYVKPMGNSFSSVRDTVVHIYSAEWVWCSRWHGTSPSAPLNPGDYPDLAALTSAWGELESKLRSFVDGLDDARISAQIDYRLMNGQAYRSPIWQMVQHLVNHGTYHRGQVATLLRQLGAKPASTDLITFHRERTIGA
jgi:uncharacterized damage-inducible protein DinB